MINIDGGQAPLACFIGEGHWLAGDEERARQNLKEASEMAEQCGAKYYAGYAQRILGESFLVMIQINLKSTTRKALPFFKK